VQRAAHRPRPDDVAGVEGRLDLLAQPAGRAQRDRGQRTGVVLGLRGGEQPDHLPGGRQARAGDPLGGQSQQRDLVQRGHDPECRRSQ
jgi:hypothetical protein